MNIERQRLAEQIFKEACGVAPSSWDSLIQSKCAGDTELEGEVRSLLDFEKQSSGLLDHTPPLLDGVTEADQAAALLPPGGKIGSYRIRSVLGVGGMGVVYVGEQERPHRTVALKVIRPGLATPSVLRRLEYEAELLGRLQHPGIAQVIEAGYADAGFGPQPFFAMELVQGLPLDKYAAQHKLGVRDRLKLIVSISEAVEHAHRRGVIHRDLKPANILVDDEGQPKILDFGVARASGGREGEQRLTMLRTGERQLIGTLRYMSPEQVGGAQDEVDTRSDVYAIGVMLYELLTGSPPYDITNKSLPDAMRVIRDQDPKRLSTTSTVYRGDLDTIALKALEKSKERRYQSAAELASDIERYLRHQPIHARPASAVYQFKKFARRNRALVGGVVATMAALVVGLAVSLTQYVRASEAAHRSEQVASFLRETLRGVDPEVARGRDNTVLMLVLNQTAARIATELNEQPRVVAELAQMLGDAYKNLSMVEKSQAMYEQAKTAAARGWGERSLQYASTLDRLAMLLVDKVELDAAEKYLQQAIEIRAEKAGENSEAMGESCNDFGILYRAKGDLAASERMYRRSLKIRSALPDRRATASTTNDLAMVLIDLGKMDEAAELSEKATTMMIAAVGEDHPDSIRLSTNRGIVLYRFNKLDEAERELRKAKDLAEKVLGRNNYLRTHTLNALSNVLSGLGKFEESEALDWETVDVESALLGPDHPEVASSLFNLSGALMDRGEFVGAEKAARRALAIDRKNYGDKHPRTASSLGGVVQVLVYAEKYVEAEALAREDVALETEILGPTHPSTWSAKISLADVLGGKAWDVRDQGGLASLAAEVESLLNGCIQDRPKTPPDFWVFGHMRGRLAETLAAWATEEFRLGNRTHAQELITRAFSLSEEGVMQIKAGLEKMAPRLRDRETKLAARAMMRVYSAWRETGLDASGKDLPALEAHWKLQAGR